MATPIDDLKNALPTKITDGNTETNVANVTSAGSLQVINFGSDPDSGDATSPVTGVLSGNSTATPLAAGATFTGTWYDALRYSNATVLIAASHDSATNGVRFEYSTNGVDIDDFDQFTYMAIPGAGQQYSLSIPGRYFRVKYTNGSTLQTFFRLQTKVHVDRPKPSTHRIADSITGENDAELVKSVSTAQNPSGIFVNARLQGAEPNNNTSTPLAANDVYRGNWFKWQDSYAMLSVAVKADTDGTFWVDFSQDDSPINGDESSVDGSLAYSYTAATDGLFREHVPIQSKWVRVRYANGSIAQTELEIVVTALTADPGLTKIQLRTIPVRAQLAGVVRSINTIPSADGNTFQEVPVSSLGNPKQSIAEIHDDILIDPLNSAQASQFIVGTTVAQLDVTPLANRRVISITNDGPLRIAIGHSPSMTFNSGSIRIKPDGTRTLGIDASVPVYAVCENLGGVQTTSNRSASSASGTATNPSNVLSSNNVYANMTSTGQTVTATGYTAGTTNAIASVRLGIELNRPSGITNTVAFQEHKTGSADSSSIVTTSASLTAVSGHLYVAAVSRRNSVANTVTNVTGLGLTWSMLVSQPSDDGQRNLDIWYAIGTPTVSGSVTATFSASVIHSHIAVSRYSNVNSTAPFADYDVGQANDSAPTVPALTSVAQGIVYFASANANRNFTAGATYTLDSNELTNDGGLSDSLAVEHKASSAGSETPTGTLNGNAHWAAVGMIINPSEAANPVVTLSYTLSAVPGATSGNITPTSASDQTFFVDITGDRSWVYGDVANVSVLATAQSIGLVQANIDYVFIELTDTTGNVSRVSIWQGAKAVT